MVDEKETAETLFCPGVVLYIIGVAFFVGVAYFLYETLAEIIYGVCIIGGGILAKALADNLNIPDLLAVAIIGLVVGFFLAPIMTVLAIKELKKK